MEDKKITIIGAGSTGLSTAYFLSKMGEEDVRILEKDFVGSGATGRCGTGIRAQFADKPTINLMKESKKLWKKWSNEMDFNFLQTGYLYLHHSEEEVERFKKMHRLQNSLGVPSRIIDKDEIQEICKHIDTSDVTAGSFNPKDGKAHPFKVALELKKFIENTEIELNEYTEVKDIKINKNGEEKKIITGNDEYNTEIIVNATGGWASKIGEMMNIKIPIEPHRHQAIITEPFKKRTIEPMIVSMKHEGAYFTQTERGGIVGGVSKPENEPPTYSMKETLKFEKRLSKAFSQIIPALKHVKILRHWAGFYAITPDHNPMIGEYKINGHYLASGFSGHGFMMAPIVGKSISKLVLNEETEYSLEYFDPYRIDRGELREPALQMG